MFRQLQKVKLRLVGFQSPLFDNARLSLLSLRALGARQSRWIVASAAHASAGLPRRGCAHPRNDKVSWGTGDPKSVWTE